MKYDNAIKREKKLKLTHDLCELYAACDCIEEFLIKVNLTYGKIPWRLLIAFKLFYIRKSRPLLYYGIKLSLCLLLGLVYLIYTTYFVMICFLPLHELMFLYLFGDNMKTIEWYDNGCPMEH